MRLFEASIQTVVLRFYLLMAVVLVSIFSGIYPLALLALPILIVTMLGVSFKTKVANEANQTVLNTKTDSVSYKTAA